LLRQRLTLAWPPGTSGLVSGCRCPTLRYFSTIPSLFPPLRLGRKFPLSLPPSTSSHADYRWLMTLDRQSSDTDLCEDGSVSQPGASIPPNIFEPRSVPALTRILPANDVLFLSHMVLWIDLLSEFPPPPPFPVSFKELTCQSHIESYICLSKLDYPVLGFVLDSRHAFCCLSLPFFQSPPLLPVPRSIEAIGFYLAK